MTQTTAGASFESDISGATFSASVSDSEPIYGCVHLEELNGQSQKEFCDLVQSYAKLHGKDVREESGLRLSFHCLQCSRIGSATGRDIHAKDTGHLYSVESSSMALFCYECYDFVYDSEMERVRAHAAGGLTASRKRKSQGVEDDRAFLKSNSTKRLCGPTGIRGLYNLGQTCYQNVILQTLLHNPLLTTYFLRDGHRAHSCEQPSCLGCAVSEAFGEFYNSEKSDGYGAVGLLLATWRTNTALAGYQQQDAHEFFQFLVDKLHESAVGEDHESSKTCRCFFHKVFYGKLRSTVTCSKCKNSTVRDDPMMDLSLDMQIQAKKRAIESSKAPATTLDLDSCLKSFTASEKLVADAYSCQICDETQPASKDLKLRRLPAILCVQLKRFEHSTAAEKVEGKLDFPMELNMLPYTTNPHSRKASNYLYDLQSAIIHKGKIDSGHYIAYCRQGSEWFLFDDDKISLATEAEVLHADAYLLFYSLRSLGEPSKKGQGGGPIDKEE